MSTVRQPQALVPSIIFPILFAAVNTAALQRTTSLPGFPEVRSFLDFILATTIVQGVMFGAAAAGTGMALDIESHFLDRLVVAPIRRSAILIGQVAGTMLYGLVQGLLFTSVLLIFGATIQGGIGAWLVILIVAVFLSGGIGAFSVALAIRTGSAEAVQGFFPLFFAFLFFSGGFFPRNLMHGWFKVVATYNPLTWMIEGMRHLVIRGFDGGQAAQAIAVPVALFVLGNLTAAGALRARVNQ